MKKILLSLIALVAIAVSCGSKYPAEMTTLVNNTASKFDSVQTMVDFESVSASYASELQALQEKYADATEEELTAVNTEAQRLSASIEAAMQRAIAADTVVADTIAVVKVK